MSLFDQLVEQALRRQPELAPLRMAVEKELLHHDILREMGRAGFLRHLTFIGGTCLRACYGSQRLSEDLDFAGGPDFKPVVLEDLGRVLVRQLMGKYGLPVTVTPPSRQEMDVATWKMRIETRPAHKHLSAQRIHIDVCAVPSHDRRPMMLRNHYGVDMGTAGLILQAQSREEILADKLVALALRSHRVKNRDLWDIVWLNRQGIELSADMVLRKVVDRRQAIPAFLSELKARLGLLQSDPESRKAFFAEMRRFLPPAAMGTGPDQEAFWFFLVDLVGQQGQAVLREARGGFEP